MNTMTMTIDRFRSLAEAYGGSVARWPAGEREAAAALMAAEPHAARTILEKADALDSVLDSWRPVAASHDVLERIVASAPVRQVRRRFSWLRGAGAGVGLAAACAAGLAVGVAFTASATSESMDTITASISDYEALSAAVGDEV